MTVSELLRMLSLMESVGLGDRKIVVMNGPETLGFVQSWSIEKVADGPYCAALWMDE